MEKIVSKKVAQLKSCLFPKLIPFSQLNHELQELDPFRFLTC